MRAPMSRRSRGVIALTVPYVPTGMKIGVGTSQCASAIVPARAFPSLLSSLKVIVEPRAGYAPAREVGSLHSPPARESSSAPPARSCDQHRVAVAVKPIAVFDGVVIGGEDALASGGGGDEDHQRRAPQ